MTSEQVKQKAPAYVEKWVNWALHEPVEDADTITKNVQYLYEHAGQTVPTVKICYGLDEFVQELKSSVVRSAVYSAVDSAVGSAVGFAVDSAVGFAVDSAVGSAVDSAVGPAVYSAVDSAVGSAVDSAVRSAVGSAVGSVVRSAVDSAVDSAVRSAVYSAVYSAVDSAVGSVVWYRVDEIAFGDFFFQEGFITDEKLKTDFYETAEALHDFVYAFYGKGIAVVLVRPKVRLNDSGLLHSEQLPAVEWKKDGLYFLNGVQFPEELWKKVVSGTMPFKDILAIEDIDQRTQAMRYGDVNEFMKHSQAEKLDEYQKMNPDGAIIQYELWRIPKGEIFTEDAYYAVYQCPSTFKKYMSGVEKCKTVAEAMSWKHYMTPKEWELLVPLVDES